MNTFIRYEGFVVIAANRQYSFSVNASSEEPRHFTVSIPPESFVSALLHFQDGPSISFQRLKVELDQETPDRPAQTHLIISGHDIEDYLVIQHPKKAAKKKRLPPYAAAEGISGF